MISVAVIAGLASVWIWTVLNDDQGIAAPLTKLLRKNDFTQKWMECPWCSGAWFALAGVLILWDGGILSMIVVWLAASAIAGMVGSYLEGS